jgi:glutaconyl-CoA decarboxylase
MKYKVTLNGKVYEVEVEKGEAMLIDEYEAKAPVPAAAPAPVAAAPAPAAAPAAAPAPAAQATAAGEQIKSPLPGNVLQIKVSVGQAVKAGDVLAVIEAMKMENDVLATKDGSVKQILVNKGATVATGDVLMVI